MSRAVMNFYMDNQLVGAANNWQGIKLTLDFDNENVQPSIESDSLEFVLAENDIIRKWIQDGINGTGVGIYEPIELRIELASGGNSITVYTGLLDMVNDMQLLDNCTVLIKLNKKGGLRQITERSQAISFAYLVSKGEITKSDYVNVSYVLAHIPDFREVLIISITIFILIKEIQEQIKNITKTIALIAGVATALPLGPIGALIISIAHLIADILYLIFIFIALKELMNQLISNLIAPLRNHKAMKLRVLLEKGATHLGYTFESTFFNNPLLNSLVVLPIKEKPPLPAPFDQFETGFPTNQGTLYTYYDMLQFFKKLINGKIRVIGNKLKVERKDFWDNISTYVLDDVQLRSFRYNADEIKANLNIEFLLDEKDDTTLINYKVNKTTFQRITEPKVINDKKNVQIKGLESVNLPVSLPTRKESLTTVENLLLRVAKLVDLFVGGNFFSSKITGRLGVLSLGNDFTGTPKLIPMALNKIRPTYRDIMSAEVLYNSSYFINTFVPVPINHNQYKKYEGIRIKFCFEDYVNLSENNHFTTSDGKQGKFERIEGSPDGGFADADFRIKEIFTTNLKDKIV